MRLCVFVNLCACRHLLHTGRYRSVWPRNWSTISWHHNDTTLPSPLNNAFGSNKNKAIIKYHKYRKCINYATMMQKTQNRIFVKAKRTTSANIRFYLKKKRSQIILSEAHTHACKRVYTCTHSHAPYLVIFIWTAEKCENKTFRLLLSSKTANWKCSLVIKETTILLFMAQDLQRKEQPNETNLTSDNNWLLYCVAEHCLSILWDVTSNNNWLLYYVTKDRLSIKTVRH